MGGISTDNILKFVLGVSGLGLSLASFTLSRVFALEEYAHTLSEKVGANQIRIEYLSSEFKAHEDQSRARADRLAILETKILITEESVRQLKTERSAKSSR